MFSPHLVLGSMYFLQLLREFACPLPILGVVCLQEPRKKAFVLAHIVSIKCFLIYIHVDSLDVPLVRLFCEDLIIL